MQRLRRNPSTIGGYRLITLPSYGQRDPATEDAIANGLENARICCTNAPKSLTKFGTQSECWKEWIEQRTSLAIASFYKLAG